MEGETQKYNYYYYNAMSSIRETCRCLGNMEISGYLLLGGGSQRGLLRIHKTGVVSSIRRV